MELVRNLIELSAGLSCLNCGRAGVVWCERCLRSAVDVNVRNTPGGVVVTAGSRYAGAVRDAIVTHKEHGQLTLGKPLARLLVAATGTRATSVEAVLTPVPSTRASIRSRGHDHSRRLARTAASIAGVPTANPLRWRAAVADQSGLSVGQRKINVENQMVARRPSRSASVAWVVDDIVTSGATIDEAVRALTSAGWVVAGASVIASVESRMALAATLRLR
ncbi:MAG TPA: ComF family protein [Actinomycetes bacterium]|nr:ComF family protein [Actinomycetes bacterium]